MPIDNRETVIGGGPNWRCGPFGIGLAYGLSRAWAQLLDVYYLPSLPEWRRWRRGLHPWTDNAELTSCRASWLQTYQTPEEGQKSSSRSGSARDSNHHRRTVVALENILAFITLLQFLCLFDGNQLTRMPTCTGRRDFLKCGYPFIFLPIAGYQMARKD